MRIRTRSALATLLSVLVVTLVVPACGDDGGSTGPGATFDLTFTGDASFQGPHGGQAIYVFVTGSDGTVVATADGTVSETQEPAFSFTMADALQEGGSYTLNYWIDSNFGGGTQGGCDAPEVDHQWKIDIGPVSDAVRIDDTHRPGETEQVCTDSDNDDTPGY